MEVLCAILDLALGDLPPCTQSDLTDEVLEAVCLERGFELVQGEAQFSHEQYVEAATQCLELVAEMNKLLDNYRVLELSRISRPLTAVDCR